MGYYVLNQQGDVIAILDETGGVAVTYEYNAWGKILDETGSGTVVSLYLQSYNHLKYRGYYYDAETGFYYLESRYYDPVIGRFINADGYVSTGQGFLGYNMYAYCGNNPVNYIDSTGYFWGYVLIAGMWLIAAVTVGKTKDKIIDNQKGVNSAEKNAAKKDPIGAWKGKEASDIANKYQQELYPNTYNLDANQANAFKHAMWNAVMTDKIGVERAEKFADAHEMPYLMDNLELCKMDLHNNELGRKIALEYAGQGYDVFAQKIQEAINGGEAYVIWWDAGN